MSRFDHYGVVVLPEDFKGANWIELCRRHGLRTLGIHSGGGPSVDIVRTLGHYGTEAFRKEVAAAGLECEYECHATASFLSPDLFKEHPEYYAFDTRRNRRRNDSNLCVTNADAMEIYHRNAETLIRQLYSLSTHRYMLWNVDCPRIYCHCDKCASLSPSDQAMLATNELARAARAVDPLATVPYLGYMEMIEPPTQIAPEPNVFLEFAPIERCYRHALNDSACATNRRYFQRLKRLLELFPASTAHVLEYYLDSSFFSGYGLPAVEVRPDRDIMDRDFDLYAELGIRSITTFAVYLDGAYFRNHGEAGLADYAEIVRK